jgi:hypothetical protein
MEPMSERYHHEQNLLETAQIRSHDVVCLEDGIPIPEGHVRLVVHLWHPFARNTGINMERDGTERSGPLIPDKTLENKWDNGNEFGIRACVHRIGDFIVSDKDTVLDFKRVIATDEVLHNLIGQIGIAMCELCDETDPQAASSSDPKVVTKRPCCRASPGSVEIACHIFIPGSPREVPLF